MEHFPECGKPVDLDRGANLAIDTSNVPSDLAPLIPLVNKWSFDNLSDQDLFVSVMESGRPDELAHLKTSFNNEVRSRIRAWAASLPFDKPATEFMDDDWNHPYWNFLNVVKLCEAIDGNEDTPEIQEAHSRFQEQLRRERYAEATNKADIAFRNSEYASYIALLSEFEDLLTDTQRKKLAIAARKATP